MSVSVHVISPDAIVRCSRLIAFGLTVAFIEVCYCIDADLAVMAPAVCMWLSVVLLVGAGLASHVEAKNKGWIK